MNLRRTVTALASVAVAGLATAMLAPAAMAEPGYLDATTTDVYEGGSVTFTTNYDYGADFVNGEYDGSGLWLGGFTVPWDDFMDCASPTLVTSWTAYESRPTPPATIEGAAAAVEVTFHACVRPDQTPLPVLQQVEVPVSGSCAVVDDAALNWGGASSGGWSASWAGWTRDGKGGAVCTRTLSYSNSLGHWVSG